MSRTRSTYIETLPDGTRHTVTYNPCHDGPVSERLTALKKVKWLQRAQRHHPEDDTIASKLRAAHRRLSELDHQISAMRAAANRTPSAVHGRSHGHHHLAKRGPSNPLGKRLDTPDRNPKLPPVLATYPAELSRATAEP